MVPRVSELVAQELVVQEKMRKRQRRPDATAMLTELLIATAMVLATVFIHAVGLLLLGRLTRYEMLEERKLAIRPLSLAAVGLTMSVVLGLFVLHALEIWLYAALYLQLGALDTLREAVYFSTQTYAAIGFATKRSIRNGACSRPSKASTASSCSAGLRRSS